MVAGAALLILLYFLYRLVAPIPQAGPTRSAVTPGAETGSPAPSTQSFLSPVFGEAIVRAEGREVSRMSAAVLGDGWLALPVSALLGGEELVFEAENYRTVSISTGAWDPGDPVAFWKVEPAPLTPSLDLAAWRPSLPLELRPSEPGRLSLRLEAGPAGREGSFTCFTRPYEVRTPGVFVQEGAVVGWTFGEPFERAYLWTGRGGARPASNIRAGEFFSSISRDSREGYFRRLLEAPGSGTSADRLEALAKGFRLAPLLAPEDLPVSFRPAAVVARMDALAAELIQTGGGGGVGRSQADQTQKEAAPPVLARDAVLALARHQDYNRAIRSLEKIEKDIFALNGPMPAELAQLKSRLYKDWLRKIIEKGDYYSGLTAFEEAQRAFPDDLEIRLLGVETAIAEKNLDRARELLEARDYPPALKEWAVRLGAQVSDKQAESEAVVIRFNPGEEHIPVDAVINGYRLHKFIVDTGASVVTIPPATLDALGIKVDDSTPVKAVNTAGGLVLAQEVTLESIQIEKCTVRGLKVLVMDIPGYPDYGILGLSFLNNFSVEIDKPNGILRLKSRRK
jgi:clan AA aspartic protease (TIGR02281 family)